MKNSVMYSSTYKSNVFTSDAAAKYDKRQQRSLRPYSILDEATRLLCAKLIFEEAKETINALGFDIFDGMIIPINVDNERLLDKNEIIDGVCDLVYVATGLLVKMNVPDLPHLNEVNKCNDAKFPGGVAIIDPNSGKYLKPNGWCGPDHTRVMNEVLGDTITPKAY